jgi:hypothetical protein
MSHRLLAQITLDTYLLARHAAAIGPLPDGRAWERVVGQLLCRPGLECRQYAGLTTLFGMNSSSHCAHELDAAAKGWRGTVIIEAKSKTGGISKADVAVFGMKTFDYYRGQLPASASAPWWRLITSAGFVADNLRRLCLQEGILLCDPVHLPIPVLLHIASQPVADQFLDDVKLGEIIRLGERACESMHDRWKLEKVGTLSFHAHQWRRNEMDDLLWLQEDLTSDVLALYDTHRPGRLETRIEQLVARLHMAAYA